MTALLAAGLTGLSLWWLVPGLHIKTSPDDIPIAMAGGSFHAHAGPTDRWLQGPNNKLVHSHGNKLAVWQVDLIDPSGIPTTRKTMAFAGKTVITFLYCPTTSPCVPTTSGNNGDKVEVSFNNSSSNDKVEIQCKKDRKCDVNSTFDPPLNHGFNHPDAGSMYSVEIPWATPPVTLCNGHCTVILHTCDVVSDNNCK